MEAVLDSAEVAARGAEIQRLAAEARGSGTRCWLRNGIPVYLLPDATSRMVTSIVVVSSGSAVPRNAE